jgi:ParB-like chromosome segregation protein Spo0J
MSEIVNKVIPIDQLKPHPRNYKKHPDAQIKRLMASVTRFSQVRSIVVQEGKPGQYMLVAGHGFTEAAKLQGLKELRADVIPATWSDEQVTGYLIADNEQAKLAEDDNTLLAEILQEQANLDYDLASLGSSQEELDALLESITQAADSDWSDALGDLPDGDKSPFEQMTFTLSNAQAEIVRAALDRAKDEGPFVDTGNENSNGNALARICEVYG